jgi:phosphoglycerate dehydrogenase-like enzyme
MSTKVYFYSPNGDQIEGLQGLAPEGVEIVWVDSKQSIDNQAEQLKDAVAVIAQPSVFPVELAQKCSNLRLVQVSSAGTDQINKAALGELGIRVANNGGGNAVAVAEHTISLMVNTYRKNQLQFQSVKDGKWAGSIRADWFHQAHEIEGKTVGIIGLGRIGSRVAKRLQGWDCEIIYHDIIAHPDVEKELGVKKVPMDELLQTSDIITLHVPLGRSTRGMISDREFDLMKPTAVLINACRGPVVDEAALIRAMEQKKIAAAGLDVLEQEPTPVDNPLLKMDNVLVTPHLASFAQESWEKSRQFAVYNTSRVAGGAEPESIVLPD